MDIPSHLPTVYLVVNNLHCPSCVETIQTLLANVPAVKNLVVSLLLHRVTFGVDTSESTSSSPTTVSKVANNVKQLLVAGGGFVVADDEKDHVPAPAPRFSDRWFGKRRQSKQDKLAELRRLRHLERCEACRADEAREGLGPSMLPNPTDQVLVTTLSIDGMTCASCTGSIEQALTSHSAVLSAEINLLSNSATIRHNATLPALEVVELVDDVGFAAEVVDSRPESDKVEEARTVRTTLSIEGMTCTSCSSAIDRALRQDESVLDVNIDVLGNKGVVTHLASLQPETIKTMVEDVGYDAEVVSSEDLDTKPQPSGARTVSIRVQGIFCNNCVKQIDEHLKSLPMLSFTPVTLHSQVTTITYQPRQPLIIRDILDSLSNLAPEFDAQVVRAQSLSERSQAIQRREVKLLASHLAVAIAFAIPSFIIAIVSMVILKMDHPFRQYWDTPVWGGANRGTVALWPLATVVQFGVGWLFYKRAFNAMWPFLRSLVPSFLQPHSMRRLPSRPLTWRSFFSFGSMDLLVTLSTTVSYFASVAMLVIDVKAGPGQMSIGTYFDSSVFLIMFILLGRTIEAYAKSRTTDAVALLGNLRPATAFLVEPANEKHEDDGLSQVVSNEEYATPLAISNLSGGIGSSVREIPVDLVEYGDILLIHPGSLPPTDGVVVSGTSKFDESSLTGESLPVTKTLGDEVFTGTTNISSAITIRVTSRASDTMLERIIKAVADASGRKAPLERAAERITGVFVPVVVYLALMVLALWLGLTYGGVIHPSHYHGPGGRAFFALEFAISLLVVACPCGIGLAVPCANAVGNGLAAAAGILASGGGEAFTAATGIKTVAFDKTGTLTVGKSVVTDKFIGDLPFVDETTLLRAVRDIEAQSTHPLAVGIVEHLGALPSSTLEIDETVEIPGRGIRASINNPSLELLIGNAALLRDNGVDIKPESEALLHEWATEAKSVVLVGARRTGSFALGAMFALSDPPRANTKSVLATLKSRGYRVVMLSGDNQVTAKAVARDIGIPESDVHAGVGPEGKATAIGEMQSTGPVMFVGDGLNDAVALAAANVSAAMGHGSQATLASADFVLLRSDLAAVLTLLKLSRKVRNRQYLNLFWAMIFNSVFLPIAAGVLFPVGFTLNPVWSAVLMAASSVSVVLSSLALRWGI